MTLTRVPRYARHRFPAEVISHAVWLYFRLPLSLRIVEEMLAARGIEVSYETVRQWALKFGQDFANQIRRRFPATGDKWHLDEVMITIAGRKHWLWRAVDQHGLVLDILVQSRRNAKAAKRDVMPSVEHRQHKGLNNRAQNSHQPTRRRERIMKRFNSARQAQHFLSPHDQVANLFRRPANITAAAHRLSRVQAFRVWAEVTGIANT